MSVIGSNILAGASSSQGYQISRSVRLRSSASAYFNRTVWSSGNRKTWSYSFWLKRGVMGSERVIAGAYDGTSTWASRFLFTAGDALAFDLGGAAQNQVVTAAVFRDSSAFYHVVLIIDTTQSQTLHSQPDSRVRIYVNGTQQTTSGTLPGLNVDTQFCINTRGNFIGTRNTEYFDGYLTEINFIDGQALTPLSFGETDAVTGVWKPKKYTGTYNTNGFYLNFSDNSAATAAAIGKDYSGNGNNWTPNNISVTAGVTYDSMLDVPTPWADGGNGRGNYATLNPVTPYLVNTTLSQGNLVATKATATSAPKIYGTIGVDSGKWYWEIKLSAQGGVGNYYALVGVSNASSPSGTDSAAVFYFGTNDATLAGDKGVNGVNSNYGANYVAGDTIGVALDCDNLQITFYKNGTSQGVITGLTAATYFPRMGSDGTSNNATFEANFGQRPFAFSMPTGFKALHTGNLPEPTIPNGRKYFDVSTWTGNGTGQTIVNSGAMQPDLVWIKDRSFAASSNLLDSVRGPRIHLESNTTNAETTEAAGVGLTSFNSNGFSLGTDNAGAGRVNFNGDTFVGWQWKEGATAGFDIVTYTGTGVARTVAHGLGVAPKMVIAKARSAAGYNWIVWHANLTSAGYYLNLNGTAAQALDTTVWNNTAPTSSVFSVGTSPPANNNGTTFVAYLFAEVSQFSKAFSFTGNGSTDGVFVFTGFLPRLILLKRTDTTGNWYLWDTARNTYNALGEELYPNLSNAAASATDLDVLSNGFKMRNSTAGFNASGGTYIGFAWASNPFKYSLGF